VRALPFAAAALAVLVACATPVAAETVVLEVGGVTRTAEIHAPVSGAKPRALVIALHGLRAPIASLRRDFALDAVATRENLVAAYPQGIEERWNYGRQINTPMPVINGMEVDDIAFLKALIARLVATHYVDPARVYLVGMSNGGLMAYRAACEMGRELAAVAAFISPMTDLQREDCRDGPLVPLFMLAGSADEFQSYRGSGEGKLGGRLLSVPDTNRFFRGRNRCSGLDTEELPDRDPADGTTVTVFRATGCEGGAEVVFYRVNGGGHRWPTLAPVDTDPHPRFGRTNRDIDSAAEVWTFFRRFRLAKPGG
jgi:polyhydroxybutyrate depolymerase